MALFNTKFTHLPKALLQTKKGLELDDALYGSQRDTGSVESDFLC
jgi:hypothetical protein